MQVRFSVAHDDHLGARQLRHQQVAQALGGPLRLEPLCAPVLVFQIAQARMQVGQQQVVVAKAHPQCLAERAARHQASATQLEAAEGHRPAGQAPQLVARGVAQAPQQGSILRLRHPGRGRVEQARRDAALAQQRGQVQALRAGALQHAVDLVDRDGVVGGTHAGCVARSGVGCGMSLPKRNGSLGGGCGRRGPRFPHPARRLFASTFRPRWRCRVAASRPTSRRRRPLRAGSPPCVHPAAASGGARRIRNGSS